MVQSPAFFLQQELNPDQISHRSKMAAMAISSLTSILICVAIIIIPFWFICKKAGFSPWLSLLNIVPFGNLILVYVLAFAEWKAVPVPQAWASAAVSAAADAAATACSSDALNAAARRELMIAS